jgi:hypothetical protein
VAEGARLESVFRGNSNVGSNPTLSAIDFRGPAGEFFIADDLDDTTEQFISQAKFLILI